MIPTGHRGSPFRWGALSASFCSWRVGRRSNLKGAHVKLSFESNRNDPSGDIVGANVFVPISLGNHYYSSEVLRQVMFEFIAKSHLSVIFLCDRLRFLSYRIRGETDLRRISANIRIQLAQMTRALMKLGLKSHPNATIADWSLLEDDPRYLGVLSSLETLIREDRVLRQQTGDYAIELMNRFRGLDGNNRDDRVQLQLQYVIEETALSLYMTEIRGYNVEVYRRGMGFVDYLYSQRPDDLMSILGKSTLDRRFISIENWLGIDLSSGNSCSTRIL
jgi:tRNA-dependent cyclodipeptide synthase